MDKQIRLFGILGIAASLIVGAGEFLLHFSPQGYEAAGSYAFLKDVSESRVAWGHFLLIVGLPLYFAGYWFIYQTLERSKWALAVLVTAVVSFSVGGIWVASRAMLVKIVQSGQGDLLLFYEGHYEILVQVLRVLVLLLSFFWVMALRKGKTAYPGWMGITSPIVLLLCIFLSYRLLPEVGKFLVPTAMNAAHLVFFGLTYFHYSRNSNLQP